MKSIILKHFFSGKMELKKAIFRGIILVLLGMVEYVHL